MGTETSELAVWDQHHVSTNTLKCLISVQ